MEFISKKLNFMIKISKFYGEMRGKGEGENTPPPPIYYWNKERERVLFNFHGDEA